MSIQDESFPVDEFLDELEFSPLAVGQRFQFPHFQREQRLQQQKQHPQQQLLLLQPQLQHENNATTTKAITTTTATNSSSEPNLSTESNQESRPSSVLSSKTSVSDADDNGSKNTEFAIDRPHTKAISYQDIHSEYTKRRFKHVASKVGQYIANMKADDQKRREAKFERHRSMPDTLSGSDALLNAGDQKRATMRSTMSVDELNRNVNVNSSNSDADGDIESAANTSATTSASAATTNNNNSDGRHETSDNTSGSDFVDKQTFALLLHEKERIQSYSEYLQTKLDEKSSENLRLKRNVDYMRIELTSCQDKLKLKEKATAKSRLPLLFTQLKVSKATQTDLKTPSPLLPPRDLYITPDTPDANNNNSIGDASTANASKTGQKTVATIQPLSLNFSNIAEHDASAEGSGGCLRQRTNSNATAQKKPINNVCAMTNKNKNNNNNNSNNNKTKTKNKQNNSRSSSDSAIDIEAAELSSSSKLKSKQQQKHERNLNATRSTQSLGRAEEFIYYDKRTGRYATLQALNVGAETKSTGTTKSIATTTTTTTAYDENNESTQTSDSSNGRKTKKHHSLRRRWLRFFGHCTRCSDPHALDNSTALQQTYTQIPLLEKSIENHCRNIR